MKIFSRAGVMMAALAAVTLQSPAQPLAPATDAEAKRRATLLNEIVMDYLRSDPQAPPGYNDILVKAETYINRRLGEVNEPFRYDAKRRIFIDRK
jgi:hypothetical protein